METFNIELIRWRLSFASLKLQTLNTERAKLDGSKISSREDEYYIGIGVEIILVNTRLLLS